MFVYALKSSFAVQPFLSAGKGTGWMIRDQIIVVIGKFMKTIAVFEASEMSSLMRADIFCSTSKILSNKI